MPTWDSTVRFLRDYEKLTSDERKAFQRAVEKFVDDLRRGQFRPGLRVKRVQGTNPSMWELTWAPDGRALFLYGDQQRPGDPHVVWQAIGGHDIFRSP